MPRNNNFSLQGNNRTKEVFFKRNPIGVIFNLESNGYYYAFFEGGGGMDSWVLVEIADMLSELNAPLEENYQKYLEDNKIDRESDLGIRNMPF